MPTTVRAKSIIFSFCLLASSCLGATVARAGEVASMRQFPTNSPLTQATPANSSTPTGLSRLKPNFSEEERKTRLNQRGFADTFLNDSLNGVSDLLGGGNNGGGFAGNEGLSPLTQEERGITQPQQPSFDPTDVIIPRSGSRR